MKTHNQIRVLLISPYFFPHIGGSQRYMEELYVHAKTRYPWLHVDVLTYNTDRAPTKQIHRGLTIYRIPCWEVLPGQFTLPHPIALIRMLYTLSQNNYHVVHTHLRFFDSTWWAWIYARIIKATSLFTEHVAGRPVHENSTVELIAKIVDQTLATWSLPRYDIVTVTNRSAQQFLNRTYHLPQPIQLIYGGVDTKYFTPIQRNRRTIPIMQKKLKSTDIVITFVGRLIWAKGAIKLYRIFRHILPNIQKNVYLAIAGDGVLASTLRKQINQDNLADRVWFLGALQPKKVKQLLQATDIFIHPSRHNEGFPNVILEAGASSNYVIATDVAGVREIIMPHTTGALIPAGNEDAITHQLIWALRNKLKTRSMGNNLRKLLIKEYDWIEISNSYMRLLISNNNSKTAKT